MCFSIERNIVVFIPSIFWLCYSLHRKQRLTFKHWKSGWEDKTLQKWLQFGLSSAGKTCTDLVFYAGSRDRKRSISFTVLIVWRRCQSGWAQPVLVFTLNYILMKMDMKESRRLHRVRRKKKQDKLVSPRGQQTGTQRVFAGAQRWQFPQQRWTEKPLEQWAEAGTVEIPQVVMSPRLGAFYEAEEMTGVVIVVALSCFPLFAAVWTVAHQAPLSVGFPSQKYWSS